MELVLVLEVRSHHFKETITFAILKKITLKEKILIFLFPYYPKHFFKTISFIVLTSFLLALRVVLQQLTIKVPGFGFNISFSWIPVYIFGWFFGPIGGFIFGSASDTLIWITNGGIWFWMYALQEPLVGFISGIVSSIYILTKKTNLKFIVIIQRFFFYGFVLFVAIFSIVNFSKISDKIFQSGSTFNNPKLFIILISTVLIFFIFIIEFQNFFIFKKNWKNKKYDLYRIFIFVSILSIIITTVFSFILGPISYVQYIKFATGKTPNG